MEDIFEELKDNEMTFLNKDPLGDFYNKEEMVFPSHARSARIGLLCVPTG